jgi:alpha-L-fucosidase
MNYIILSVKHRRDGGFSLWPTKGSDFSVAHAPDKTDVAGVFVEACRKHDIKPAFYLGGDEYNVPGGIIGDVRHDFFEVSRAYMDHTLSELDELLSWYGPIEEIWFDGPHKFGVTGRRELTDHIAGIQPDTVIAMNGTWEDDGKGIQVKPHTWPSDVVVIEAGVPPIWSGDNWRALTWDQLGNPLDTPRAYYMPVENCSIAHVGGFGWWWAPTTQARSLEELLGIRLLCHTRNSNCVFNVTPDRRGLVPDDQARVLIDLREKWEAMGLS